MTLSIGDRSCDSYNRRKREHDECSLDGTPGFEADMTRPLLTPEEITVPAEDHAALCAAIDCLPPVQARRVYARFILGRSVGQIAKASIVIRPQRKSDRFSIINGATASTSARSPPIHANTYGGIYPEEISALQRDYSALWGPLSDLLKQLAALVEL